MVDTGENIPPDEPRSTYRNDTWYFWIPIICIIIWVIAGILFVSPGWLK